MTLRSKMPLDISCLVTSLFVVFFLSLGVTDVQAQDNEEQANEQRSIVANSALNYDLLEPNQHTRKVHVLLDAHTGGKIEMGKLYLGASMIALADYQVSNTDSKFGYLMRHPTANNQIGKVVSEAVLHSAQVMLAGAINNWLTMYAEFLYDPQQSFGQGSITSLTRNQVQLRRGYIVFGNLNEFPVYGALGKMDVNFGNMGSVSPFTNSTMWHAFAGLGYGALVGVSSNGINASFTAVQGGPQFRALHVPVERTNVPSRLNNFVVDANYTIDLGGNGTANVGVSYEKGSPYCQGFPVVHFMPCNDSNAASTVYASVNTDRLRLEGGFAKTADEWEGTHNPTPPLNVHDASKVSSFVGGVSYLVSQGANTALIVSGEFSNFIAGPNGAPWELQNQIILGGSLKVSNSAKLFLELFRTEGYAPLNFISGGNFENPGVTHSDRDARGHGVVFGGQIVL